MSTELQVLVISIAVMFSYLTQAAEIKTKFTLLYTFFIQSPSKQVNGIWKKVLRKIFGPTKERDGTWRIKTNDKFDELIRHKNIINHIKAQRLSWFGHLHRMPEERMVKRVYKWKTQY